MLISFLVALLLAAVGVLVSLRAESARQAYQKLSIVMIVVWVLPALGVQFLPKSALASISRLFSGLDMGALFAGVTAALLVAIGVILSLAMARFKRSRLILD
jgi:ABC-2 type transport system permease protein